MKCIIALVGQWSWRWGTTQEDWQVVHIHILHCPKASDGHIPRCTTGQFNLSLSWRQCLLAVSMLQVTFNVTLNHTNLPLGWLWLWSAHLQTVCQVLPGGTAALLNGRPWHRCSYIHQSKRVNVYLKIYHNVRLWIFCSKKCIFVF